MASGYKATKLPKRFSKLTIKRSVLAALVNKSSPHIRKVERILRPRLLFMTSDVAKRIIGFFVLLFSFFILLPIPLSNFVPGFGVLIISFGLLGKDGLVIILGIVVGGFGMALSMATLMLGAEFITSFF
jgi:hypothetical protein